MLTLDLKGFSEVMANLEKMDDKIKQEVSGTLERGAQTFVRNAKRDAPVDHGVLKNGITYRTNSPFSFTPVSNAEYSAYVEFGIIKYVFFGEYWLTDEEVTYAEQFKGTGKRKTGGIYPHPFFFKQQTVVKQQIEQGIDAILKDLKL